MDKLLADIKSKISSALENKQLLLSASQNLNHWLDSNFLPDWAISSISELISNNHWDELNDRFYETIAFGTGGMRNRTKGKIVTSVEKEGNYPSVGSAYLNTFTVLKATIGLFRYCKKTEINKTSPKLIIAHDVRHFSDYFTQLVAFTWTNLGGHAYVFNGPRSTPQLSFTVRHLKATAGVVITASHNPPHDNGFKAYYKDGGQVVPPHDSGIINEVNAVALSELIGTFNIYQNWNILGPELDEAYRSNAINTILDPQIIRSQAPKIVYTPIHGTGSVATVPILKKLGVNLKTVDSQLTFDPNFSTVSSPNPENHSALTLGIKLADESNINVVIGTDPDADRMGVAVRDDDGKMIMLTGNIIGSMLALYRINTLKKLNKLPKDGSAALIKTFVTTDLQSEIASKNGLKTINTLTGFKWIGSKLLDYENTLKQALPDTRYESLDSNSRRELLLQHSTYCVFAGEESYGYLADDKVRDKDANAAVAQFCELTAFLSQQNISFRQYLNQIYSQYGYFTEDLLNIQFEGAQGSQKISNILKSYTSNPPKIILDDPVTKIIDFAKDSVFDADNKPIPKQSFFIIELQSGYKFAIRASGTEPKIKFYLFAKELNPTIISQVELKAKTKLKEMREWIHADALKRAETAS